mmetsp:Transcript_18192/g.31948  ORF Transcript_18192/g.31948 Transcript_18192/m.31948 type:complete len:385 (+) Transcript_18192:48-1202(+)
MDLLHLQSVGLQPICSSAFTLFQKPAEVTFSVDAIDAGAALEEDEEACVEESSECATVTEGDSEEPIAPEDLSEDPVVWEVEKFSKLTEREEDIAEGCRRPPVQFLDLPDVIDALGAACCDAVLLARLGLANSALYQVTFEEGFALRRALDLVKAGHKSTAGCKSLEEIALGQACHELCAGPTRNHLYFPYGGGLEVRSITRHLLKGAALLAARHPQLCIHIDAHTGAGAPAGIATSTAKRRAQQVLNDLVALGVQREQISTTAWGKRVSSLWSEPEDDTAARAEVFLKLGNKEFPKRSDYYQLVPEARRPTAARPMESSDEEEMPQLRRTRMLAMLRILGFPQDVLIRRDAGFVAHDEDAQVSEQSSGDSSDEERSALLRASS